MTTKELPTWATVGATVWLRPYTYSRTHIYNKAIVTRVTKTSIFVTEPGRTYERRFIAMHGAWFGAEDVMEEYGNRGTTWTHPTYLFGPDSETVETGLAASEVSRAYNETIQVLARFTANGPTIDRKTAALASIDALNEYLSKLEG